MTDPESHSPSKALETEPLVQQEQIPFLNEETLQNLANSYKELNE